MAEIKKVTVFSLSIILLSALLLFFITGCGDSSIPGKPPVDNSKPVQEVKSVKPTAKDLMAKLIGNWKNDNGDTLTVTDSEITYFKSDGNEGVGNVEYKFKGLESALPNAVRIELGRLGMLGDAVAVFNNDNYITFGIIGEMPVKFIRK